MRTMKNILKISLVALIVVVAFPVLAQNAPKPGPFIPTPFGSELLFAGLIALAGFFGIKVFGKSKKN